jgi:ribonuclease-3
MEDISKLEKKIGVIFKNKDLLLQALVHRSYINENRDFRLDHNERLEFLGDAVLELVSTEYLYKKFPDHPEGDLTNFRAALVNSKMLAEMSGRLGVEEHLIMSKGERKDTGKARQYLLANALEAIIGSIYLDQGYRKSKKFITDNILCEMERVLEEKLYQDPKSEFQEKAQEKTGITPNYEVLTERGPDHNKHFVIGAYLEKELIAEGEGSSKQAAQRAAAKKALEVKKW